MNEPLICLAAFVFIVLWRELQLCCLCCRRVREKTNRTCSTAWWFQWYFIMAFFLVYMMCIGLYQFISHEILYFNWLAEDKVNQSLAWVVNNATASHALREHDFESLKMPSWLRRLSIGGAVAGVFAFCVVLLTFSSKVLRGRNSRMHLRKEGHNAWRLDRKHDYALLVIIMPAALAVLAIQAQCRLWSLMTGTAWQVHRPCYEDQHSVSTVQRIFMMFVNKIGDSIRCGYDFTEIKDLEIWTANINLEIACLLQYIPIWAFCMMVIEYFEFFNAVSDKASKENFCIDKAVYVDEAGLTGKLTLDVTEKVIAAVRQNGARDITRGRPLKKLLPEIRSGFTNFIEVTRGRRVQKFYEQHLPLCCFPRTRFNLARLDPIFDFYFTIKSAGLLGVWVYIAIGVLRSVLSLSFRVFAEWDIFFHTLREAAHEEARLYGWMESMTNLAMIVCIINMIFVLRNQDLVHPDALGRCTPQDWALPNANFP